MWNVVRGRSGVWTGSRALARLDGAGIPSSGRAFAARNGRDVFRRCQSSRNTSVLQKLERLNLDEFTGVELSMAQRQAINRLVLDNQERNFEKTCQEIGEELTIKAFNSFRRHAVGVDSRLLRRASNISMDALVEMTKKPSDHPDTDRMLYTAALRHARTFFRPEYEAAVQVNFAADFRQPHNFYAAAREKKRKIIYHFGPTNSGKTYSAMMALKKCAKGIYAGPLRLLALEAFEKLNRAGVLSDLVTGQERREVPFSTHKACTVEMLSVEEEYDVAVIDEIQLIGDLDRGHAWTRAVLGVNAKEVHLCGDGTAVRYERRSPLKPMETSLRSSIAAIEDGDAIIAFSRNDLFRLKHEVETLTKKKCCVIYGNLPPETRARQARLFNDADSGYNVLIATDAVGMGLNLNIGRVIFSAVEKVQNGSTQKRKLTAPQIRQIAGRAGRDGTLYSAGAATCLHEDDMQYFLQAFHQPPEPLQQAGMLPSADQLVDFGGLRAYSMPFSVLLDKFAAVAKLEDKYTLCETKMETYKGIADLIEDECRLSMTDRYLFVSSPVQILNEALVKEFVRIVREFAADGYARLYADGKKPEAMTGFGRTTATLLRAESHCMLLDTYLYLAQQIGPSAFVDWQLAEAIRSSVVQEIEVLLREARYVPPKANEDSTASESQHKQKPVAEQSEVTRKYAEARA